MSSAATVPAVKVSWLKHFGQILGKILNIVATAAKPIAALAAPVAEALMPQFAGAISLGDNIVTNIAKEAVAVEGATAAAGTTSGSGVAKLAAVVAATGPAIDAWVSSAFPGATVVSAASKAGLVNAVVGIMNEMSPATASTVAPARAGSTVVSISK